MTQAEAKKSRNMVMMPDRISNFNGGTVVVADLGLEALVNAQQCYKAELSKLAEEKAAMIEKLKEVPTLELGLRAINQQIRHLTK